MCCFESLLSPGMWDKQVSLLSSSALARGRCRRWAMALAHVAVSSLQPVPPRRLPQHTAAGAGCALCLPVPADPLLLPLQTPPDAAQIPLPVVSGW